MDPNNEEQLLSFKFETRDKLLGCVRAFYSKRGYALSVLRSKAEKSVVLQCDRGGLYRNTRDISVDQRKKFTGSSLIDCPFQLYGKKNKEGTWTIEIRNNEHNHDPSNDISSHCSFRRPTKDELKFIEHMTNAGVQPRQILSSLRQQNPDTRIVLRTIYNATQKIRKDNLEGKTIIQALFEEFAQGDMKIIKKKMCLAIENEFNEISVQLTKEKRQVPHACNIPFFRNLMYRISLFALRELHKQYDMAKKGTMNPICTGQFMATMGMPCAHQMVHLETGSLSLDQVHTQWRIDSRELNYSVSDVNVSRNNQFKNQLDNLYMEYLKWPLDKQKMIEEKIQQITNNPYVLFEPTIPTAQNRLQVTKRRKARNSTRRDPSQFEIAEASWQGTSSNRAAPPNQMHQDTDISTTEFSVPETISDDNVLDWIDRNM